MLQNYLWIIFSAHVLHFKTIKITFSCSLPNKMHSEKGKIVEPASLIKKTLFCFCDFVFINQPWVLVIPGGHKLFVAHSHCQLALADEFIKGINNWRHKKNRERLKITLLMLLATPVWLLGKEKAKMLASCINFAIFSSEKCSKLLFNSWCYLSLVEISPIVSAVSEAWHFSALIQRTWKRSALIGAVQRWFFLALKHWFFSAEQRWFMFKRWITLIQLWFNTCRWQYQNVITQSGVIKTPKVVIKMAFLVLKKCTFFSIFCKMTAKNHFFSKSSFKSSH